MALSAEVGRPDLRLAGELPPVEEDHRFADGQFLGYLTDRRQGGRRQLVEHVIGDRFPVPLSPRDLAVGGLDDLGGFPGTAWSRTSGSGWARARSAAWGRAAIEGLRSMAVAAPQRW